MTTPDDDPAADAPEASSGAGATAVGELLLFAEVLALTGVAFAQPVLDTFRQGPDIFVFRRATTLDVIGFVAVVTLVPPAVLYAGTALIQIVSREGRRLAHLAVLGLLVGVLGWQLVERHTDAAALIHWLAAGGTAVAGGLLLHRFEPLRSMLRLLAMSPLVVASIFLFTDPVARLTFDDGPGTVQGVQVDNPVPVVMVIMDELPIASLIEQDGSIDETLFPNFAAIADGSTWYRNHTSVSPSTPEAVPAILTGRYPTELGQLPIASVHPENVFTALEDAYDLNVWEITTQLCEPEICPEEGGSLNQGLRPLLHDAYDLWREYMDEPPPEEEQEFAIRQSDPGSADKFARFVASIAPSDGRQFDFLHILNPHQPWHKLPGGAKHEGPFLAEGLGAPAYSWSSEYFAQAARQRHLLQLQSLDELLGDLLARLESTGRWDDSVIVFTSDHGAAFQVGAPIRGLADANVAEIMWTPFFVRAPGLAEGAVIDAPTTAVDVLPTLADLIGLHLTWDVDGRSALGEPRGGTDLRRFYDWSNNRIDDPDADHVLVDGVDGYTRLFATEPAGGEPRDDLQVFRFGRWGDLVGTEVSSHARGEPSPVIVTLLGKDQQPLDPDTYAQVDIDADVLPVYVRGEVSIDPPVDLVVAVNGFVGQWGTSFADQIERDGTKYNATTFFALFPPQLLADGANTVEVFEVRGTPEVPTLHAVMLGPQP